MDDQDPGKRGFLYGYQDGLVKLGRMIEVGIYKCLKTSKQ